MVDVIGFSSAAHAALEKHALQHRDDPVTADMMFLTGYDTAAVTTALAYADEVNTTAIGADMLGYLLSLVRQDIRKHQKSIDRFAPRASQGRDEAGSVLTAFIAKQEFRLAVHKRLRESYDEF